MSRRRHPIPEARPCFASRGVLAAAAAGLLLAGCSSLPDAVNPVAWADSITGTGPRGEVPGQDADYPNLASVPDGPRDTTSQASRAAIAAGLVADRENARYTDQVLRGGVPTAPAPAQVGQAPAFQLQDMAEARAPSRAPVAAGSPPPPPQVEQAPAFQIVEREPPPAQVPAEAPAPAELARAPDTVAPDPVGGDAVAPAATPDPASLAGTIFFAPASARIGDNDRELLTLIAGAHARRGGTVRVIGRASADGGADPEATSRQRAESVAEALNALGVARDRLRVEWTGEAAADAGLPGRRADIYLES